MVPFPIIATLKRILKEYYDRMYICEEQKWDLEREVRKRDWEVQQLSDTLFFVLTMGAINTEINLKCLRDSSRSRYL